MPQQQRGLAKMKTIGIRAAPKAVTFVIYDSAAKEVVSVDTIKIPKVLDTPDALKYVRNTLLDVIREYGVEKAGIRIMESTAQSVSIERIQLEGVIQEAFASSSVLAYYCGQISKISALLGIPRADFKKYVSGDSNFEAVENWGDLSQEEREAMLAAMGAVDA